MPADDLRPYIDMLDPADPPTFSRPHPTLSQPWGDPDYDHSCEDCREGRHGRLAKPDPADPPSPLTRFRFVPDTFDSLARMEVDPEGEWVKYDAALASSPAPAGLDEEGYAPWAAAEAVLPAMASGITVSGLASLDYTASVRIGRQRGHRIIAATAETPGAALYKLADRLRAATRPAEDAT